MFFGGDTMQVGDLVYIPYYGAYGIIVSKYHDIHDDEGEPDWNVAQPCGYCSAEYEDDLLEVVCK